MQDAGVTPQKEAGTVIRITVPATLRAPRVAYSSAGVSSMITFFGGMIGRSG
jgi:hypothetical protein